MTGVVPKGVGHSLKMVQLFYNVEDCLSRSTMPPANLVVVSPSLWARVPTSGSSLPEGFGTEYSLTLLYLVFRLWNQKNYI